jgi:long-chain acyl-CoA synthetase
MSSGKTFKATATPSLALLLNPLAWFLWILDFAIWVLTFGWVKTLKFYLQPSYSVEVGPAVRRNRAAVDKLFTSPVPEGEGGGAVLTTPKLFAWAAAKYGDEKAMGTRTYLGEYKEAGWRFPKKKFGATTWMSFRELKAKADAFGAALVATRAKGGCGMQPVPQGKNVEDLTGPHTILLFEDTCADWMTCALGALSQSLVVATSYATLGIDAVGEAIKASNITTVVTNRKNVERVASLKQQCKTLQTIIYTEFHVAPEDQGKAVSVPKGLTAIPLADCFAFEPTREAAEPTPEQVAVIMYTSGSTGKPKGVLLKHESVLASIAGLLDVLGKAATTGDCYLGYLPQSHILEFCAELTCLALGMHIGYADPRTLTSTGAVRERPDGSINQKPEWPCPPGAIQEFRPTFMAGVPKVWDILKKVRRGVL